MKLERDNFSKFTQGDIEGEILFSSQQTHESPLFSTGDHKSLTVSCFLLFCSVGTGSQHRPLAALDLAV